MLAVVAMLALVAPAAAHDAGPFGNINHTHSYDYWKEREFRMVERAERDWREYGRRPFWNPGSSHYDSDCRNPRHPHSSNYIGNEYYYNRGSRQRR